MRFQTIWAGFWLVRGEFNYLEKYENISCIKEKVVNLKCTIMEEIKVGLLCFYVYIKV